MEYIGAYIYYKLRSLFFFVARVDLLAHTKCHIIKWESDCACPCDCEHGAPSGRAPHSCVSGAFF